MDIIVTKDNIHIKNSYRVKSALTMNNALNLIRKSYTQEECIVLTLSNDTLIKEWRAHNFLYKLGLFKSHTKDVDLNIEPWYRRVIYSILSLLYK